MQNSIALAGFTRLFPLYYPDLFYMLSFIDTVFSFYLVVVCFLNTWRLLLLSFPQVLFLFSLIVSAATLALKFLSFT